MIHKTTWIIIIKQKNVCHLRLHRRRILFLLITSWIKFFGLKEMLSTWSIFYPACDSEIWFNRARRVLASTQTESKSSSVYVCWHSFCQGFGPRVYHLIVNYVGPRQGTRSRVFLARKFRVAKKCYRESAKTILWYVRGIQLQLGLLEKALICNVKSNASYFTVSRTVPKASHIKKCKISLILLTEKIKCYAKRGI